MNNRSFEHWSWDQFCKRPIIKKTSSPLGQLSKRLLKVVFTCPVVRRPVVLLSNSFHPKYFEWRMFNVAFSISEAFVESTPQLHLYLMLLAINIEYVAFGINWTVSEWYNFPLFVAGLTSSVLSACLGMTRLLMDGPSKLVKKQGYLGGYQN